MSEVPELRAAVRASAQRHCCRRRWRAAHRVAPAIVVVAACAVALVVSSSPNAGRTKSRQLHHRPRRRRRRVTPSSASREGTRPARARSLRSRASTAPFAARPRGSDQLRGFSDGMFTMRGQPRMQLDRANARRLAISGEHALYAAPALQNGRTALCAFLTRRGRPGGAGCGPFDPARIIAKPRWSKTSTAQPPCMRSWSRTAPEPSTCTSSPARSSPSASKTTASCSPYEASAGSSGATPVAPSTAPGQRSRTLPGAAPPGAHRPRNARDICLAQRGALSRGDG